jgi:molybdopterin/thiamine biosynthesis adenylyltransferase
VPRPWTFTMDADLRDRLMRHLFPGDHDEHGAVIAAGITETTRGTRLIARELHLAIDGIDFVPGRRGYRMLTPEFVRDKIRYCRDEDLIYLAIHNHGGSESVAFSGDDARSHERGYPALLDISGQPVGALVFAHNAVAGDIWTPDRQRRGISEAVVVGRNLEWLYPSPPPRPPEADRTFDRQVRWFGDRGQYLLGRMKVGVVGAGGVGLPLTTMLARLGIGHLVVIDPDRVDNTNLPRMPEARRLDAMMPLRFHPRLDPLANRLGTRKVRLARRSVRRGNRKTRFTGLTTYVNEPAAAAELIDCDFIFLAADSHLGRMLVNAVAYQYLIPTIQLGCRIDLDRNTGEVGDIRANSRLILPTTGCLRCNQLLSPSRLQDDARDPRERRRNRYVDEIPVPSVITLNTALAAQAANDFLLMTGGLITDDAPLDYLRSRPRRRRTEPVGVIPNDASCPDCGAKSSSRRGRGDGVALPLPERRGRG